MGNEEFLVIICKRKYVIIGNNTYFRLISLFKVVFVVIKSSPVFYGQREITSITKPSVIPRKPLPEGQEKFFIKRFEISPQSFPSVICHIWMWSSLVGTHTASVF